MKLTCSHCGTDYDGIDNHCESGIGHWEYVDTADGIWEIWYCC
jgi:hypothetical protein